MTTLSVEPLLIAPTAIGPLSHASTLLPRIDLKAEYANSALEGYTFYMRATRTPQWPDAAVCETATRLRVGIGAFKRRTQEALSEGELTVPQLTALSRLDRLGASTTAELARREQITPQGMGATIASLEQLNLIVRQPDPTDRRRAILTLTPAGRAVIGSGRNRIVDQVAIVLAERFSAEEIATLDAAARLIERIAELL
jgi:DNA-binding MarR family transcriptional regulator